MTHRNLLLVTLSCLYACDRTEDDPAPAQATPVAPKPSTEKAANNPADDPVATPIKEALPVQAPAPLPCRVLRVVFTSSEEAGSYALTEIEDVQAATSLEDWKPSHRTAPPVLTESAWTEVAAARDGVYIVEAPALTIALDVRERQALAVSVDAASKPATVTQYIYDYRCETIGFDIYPGADEGSEPDPRFASGEVPTHAEPGQAATGTMKVRKGAKVPFNTYRTLVKTPAVGWAKSPIAGQMSLYNSETRSYAGSEVAFEIPRGRVAYVWAYEGEGTCYIGDGERIVSGDCLDETLERPRLAGEATPLEFSWWLQVQKPAKAWIEATPDHVESRFGPASF